MNIDLEKDIVQSLSSLYPLQEFEERAIDTVLDAIPHWIPVTERLPKEEGFYIVTLEHRYGAETNIRFFKIENGERYWSLWGNENITAYSCSSVSLARMSMPMSSLLCTTMVSVRQPV